MKIAGTQKTTLIDYPEHIATIIFTQGCNYRCPYCHNPDLISNSSSENNYINLDEFWKFIDKRKNLIDGLVISGGEPTLQNDLVDFIKKIKTKNLKVKLDTNGSNYNTLKKLIDESLVDYIAMDIKAPLEKYPKVAGISTTSNIEKSLNLIKESQINYEFRTTVVPTLHQSIDFHAIGKLIQGAKKYYIQNFRGGNTFNNSFNDLTPFPPNKLKEFQKIASLYVKEVIIRN